MRISLIRHDKLWVYRSIAAGLRIFKGGISSASRCITNRKFICFPYYPVISMANMNLIYNICSEICPGKILLLGNHIPIGSIFCRGQSDGFPTVLRLKTGDPVIQVFQMPDTGNKHLIFRYILENTVALFDFTDHTSVAV